MPVPFLMTVVRYLSKLSRKDQGSRLDCYRECCVEKFCFGCDARLRPSVADRLATSRYRRRHGSRRVAREGECIRIHWRFEGKFCLSGRGNQAGFLFSTIHLETRTGRVRLLFATMYVRGGDRKAMVGLRHKQERSRSARWATA